MIVGSYGKNMVSFVSNCQTIFQSECTISIIISNEWVLFIPHPSQHLVLSMFQILGHSNWCVVESYFWCNLHFSHDIWCGGYIFFCHLCISFGEVSVKVFGPFYSSFLFSYCWVLRVICILWIIALHQIYLLQIFSSYLWLVLSFS